MIAPGTKRLTVVAVRLTDAEKATLDALSAALGQHKGGVLRCALAALKAQQNPAPGRGPDLAR